MDRTLKLSIDAFDQDSTFNVTGGITCALKRDYEKKGDGIYWGLNSGTCLKSHYTEADRAECDRLASEEPIHDGDVIEIDGHLFTARVMGHYSDAVIFRPAN